VFHISTANWSSPLWAQGELVSTPILKRIHLLLYNVGLLTDAAYEEASVLEGGSVDALIPVEFTGSSRLLSDIAPIYLLSG
jgi:hypothetical protein